MRYTTKTKGLIATHGGTLYQKRGNGRTHLFYSVEFRLFAAYNIKSNAAYTIKSFELLFVIEGNVGFSN